MAATDLGPGHDLAKRLSKLERDVANLSTRDVLQNASIGTGGLTVDGTGGITVTGGGSLTINGGGEIIIPDGGNISVGGANVVAVLPASGSASASNYALTTTAQELTRITFTVPSGFTRAQVFASMSFTCFNQSTTTADQLWGRVDINGHTPADQPGWTPPVAGGSVTSAYGVLLSGMSGGNTFYVRAQGWNRFGNTGAAAGNLNVCTIAAQVLYLA